MAAVLAHRTLELDGASLVRELRKLNSAVPIVIVSGLDREKVALEAGVTRFFNFDQWPRIGIFVVGVAEHSASESVAAGGA